MALSLSRAELGVYETLVLVCAAKSKLRAGGLRLQAKVKRFRPTVVGFTGINPYRVISGAKDAHIGLQKSLFGNSHAWVLPDPSGLNAHYLPATLAQLFGELRLWAVAQHERRRDIVPN